MALILSLPDECLHMIFSCIDDPSSFYNIKSAQQIWKINLFSYRFCVFGSVKSIPYLRKSGRCMANERTRGR